MHLPESKDFDPKFGRVTQKEYDEFTFYEKQLGVIDTKAQNVLWVDSVLIVITTLTSLFQTDVGRTIRQLSAVATTLVLVSVFFCTLTIWVKWATDLEQNEQVMALRDKKTRYLKWSLTTLIVALFLYVVLLLFGVFQ
jgi:hypothetical protein